MNKQTVIKARNIGKQYFLSGVDKYYTLRDLITDIPKNVFHRIKNSNDDNSFWALKDVSFDLHKGDVLGIIGPNGAGKSTLLKILSKIILPTEGVVTLRGKTASMLEVGTGFNQELTGRENVYLNGAILGMKRREIDKQFDSIVDFSEIEKFIDTPVKRYSSGMQVRLAFSVAAHLNPEILLLDEVLAVGDISFQRKSLAKMYSIARDEGRTVILVSHNMTATDALCNKAMLIEDGKITAFGKTRSVISRYIKDFTAVTDRGMLNSKIRGGNGKIRVLNFWMEDEHGKKIQKPKSGQKISFVFPLKAGTNEQYSDVDLGFSVLTQTEQILFANYWTFTGKSIRKFGPEGIIKFTFDHFPLAEGQYKLAIRLTVKNEDADYIPSTAFFEVEEGDFYNTRIITKQKLSSVYIPGTWSANNTNE